MGTQRSSKGPSSGVPLIPSWVQPVEVPTEQTTKEPEKSGGDEPNKPGDEEKPSASPPSQPDIKRLSQPARFIGARRGLGQFASSGSRSDLESGLGHYVRSGYGGSAQGARRMGGTARVAGSLIGGLEGFRAGENRPAEFGLDRATLSGKPAREVGDRIIDAVCPVDGTQDSEATRDSLSRSISELAEQFTDLDLTALTPEQISLLLERFVANDLSHRIELDVGKHIFDKSPDYATAVRRMEEMREYVREKVSACFRSRGERGQKLTRSGTALLTATVLQDTMAVFEDYVR